MREIAYRTRRRDDRKPRRVVRRSAEPYVVQRARRKQKRQLLANVIPNPQALKLTEPIGLGRILQHVVEPGRLEKQSAFRRLRADGGLHPGPGFAEQSVAAYHGAADRALALRVVIKGQRRRDDSPAGLRRHAVKNKQRKPSAVLRDRGQERAAQVARASRRPIVAAVHDLRKAVLPRLLENGCPVCPPA